MSMRWQMVGDHEDTWECTAVPGVTMRIWTPDFGGSFRWCIKRGARIYGGETTGFGDAITVCTNWVRSARLTPATRGGP